MVLILQIARFLFLFFFFACEGHPRKSIVSLLIVGQTSSSPFQALFFHIFSLKFLLLRLTLADHSFFFSNIHWSKYYLFQLIVNKQTKVLVWTVAYLTRISLLGVVRCVTCSLAPLLYYAISRLDCTAAAVMCFTGQAVVRRSHARAT